MTASRSNKFGRHVIRMNHDKSKTRSEDGEIGKKSLFLVAMKGVRRHDLHIA
jgi:hypothetical protein